MSLYGTYLKWRFAAPFDWAQDSFNIAKTPLSGSQKMRVFWTHTLLSMRRWLPYSRASAEANVMGFRVKAYSLQMLHFLHREMFVALEYLFDCEKPNPVIVDCGSNIGMSVLFFKAVYPQAKVTAFEPSAETFALLQENVTRNGLSDVVLHRCAVGEYDGTVTFFSDATPGSPIASTNSLRMSAQKTSVPQVRLSRYIQEEVDLLKLDVEGAEEKVMQELADSGAMSRIRRMIIEYHHHVDRADDFLSRFLGLIEAQGFGYLIEAHTGTRRRAGAFQDLLIYAYRKNDVQKATSTARPATAAQPA